MLEIIRRAFTNTTIEELDLVVRLGLLNKKTYKPTNTPLESAYIYPILQMIVDNVNQKVNNEELTEMVWEDYSSKTYNYIEFDEENMYNPLTDEANQAVEPRGYNEVTKKSGDIVVLEITIADGTSRNKVVVYIENDQVGALHKGYMCKITGNPTVISNEDVVMINPARLIAIHGEKNQILIIKNNIRAKTLFALNDYYRNKAKSILSELVINADALSENLTDDHIRAVLNNSETFSREYFDRYSSRYLSYLYDLGIGLYSGDENDSTMIDLSSEKLDDFISKIPAYTKKSIISQEEVIVEAM